MRGTVWGYVLKHLFVELVRNRSMLTSIRYNQKHSTSRYTLKTVIKVPKDKSERAKVDDANPSTWPMSCLFSSPHLHHGIHYADDGWPF